MGALEERDQMIIKAVIVAGGLIAAFSAGYYLAVDQLQKNQLQAVAVAVEAQATEDISRVAAATITSQVVGVRQLAADENVATLLDKVASLELIEPQVVFQMRACTISPSFITILNEAGNGL